MSTQLISFLRSQEKLLQGKLYHLRHWLYSDELWQRKCNYCTKYLTKVALVIVAQIAYRDCSGDNERGTLLYFSLEQSYLVLLVLGSTNYNYYTLSDTLLTSEQSRSHKNEVLKTARTEYFLQQLLIGRVCKEVLIHWLLFSGRYQPLKNAIFVKYVAAFCIWRPAYSITFFIFWEADGTIYRGTSIFYLFYHFHLLLIWHWFIWFVVGITFTSRSR